MYPRLLLGPVTACNYSVLSLLGVVVGIIVSWRLSIEAGVKTWRFLLLAVGTVLVGALGSHWLYVCTAWDRFPHWQPAVLYFWNGRAFIGGPVAAVPFTVWFAWRLRLPIWKTLDVLAPGLAIGHVFGRFGCCAAGCCHGCPTESWLGIRFIT